MNRCLLCRCPKYDDQLSGRDIPQGRAWSSDSLAAKVRAASACLVGAVQAVLWFVAGHPVAVMTAVVALSLGIAVEVAIPMACLVDAGIIGTAAFGPRSIGRLPWSWSHACRYRRRLPYCRRPRAVRVGLCRVGDRLATLPRFRRDGTLTWSAYARNVDEVADAKFWLRWLAERDAKIAAVESLIAYDQPPLVEIRLRPCGPGQWSNKAERVVGSAIPIGLAPDPDTPGRLGDGARDQPIRLGILSDAETPVESPGDSVPHPLPIMPARYRQRDLPSGTDTSPSGSSGVA